MKPESFVELVDGGNGTVVEEAWMNLVADEEVSVSELAEYDVVLRRLRETDQHAKAQSLAWAAIESARERCDAREALSVACVFLQAVEESQELRDVAVKLYQEAYADQPALDVLLDKAGLAGGRPVRRAVRTLEVLLSLSDGDYLAARDDDAVTRVERIDPRTWRVSITGSDGNDEFGPVELADRFRPAEPSEFRVMRHFAPEKLAERLRISPADVVIELCRENGGAIDSDAIEQALVPDLVPAKDWKKWCTRARSALQRNPNVTLEGRNPWTVTYVEAPVGLTEQFRRDFGRLHDPAAKLDCAAAYLSESRARNEPACRDALGACVQEMVKRAENLTGRGAAEAGLWWSAARRIAEIAGIEDGMRGAAEYFGSVSDPFQPLAETDRGDLLSTACDCMVEALDDWPDRFAALLPTLPQAVCDATANRLLDHGWDSGRFEPIVKTILDSPVVHFEALLWLWDGPTRADRLPATPLPQLFSKILAALEECRRSDTIPKAISKRIGMRARAVLSVRKYERFHRCLDDMEPGLARTLRTRVERLDSLGRSVAADLSGEIRRRFPRTATTVETKPWELEDVLYCTADGFARKQEEIEHHVNVSMKKNAKAIGDAAERGDLSENSEYKFALEERDLLQARLAQMNSELASARVISPENVPTEYVGIGTKVCMKRTGDGEPYEITLVGPWEADLEKGWINYKAPLARKILGLCVGDLVEFDHSAAKGTYEIVALENALAPATSG